MIDPRFYESLGAVSARALAAGLDVGGDADRLVLGVAAAEEAGPQDLCYLERPNAVLTRAPGACILPVGQARFAPKAAALIFSDHPRATFARLAPRLARPRSHEGMALIHVSARLETDVRLAPGVVIGPDAEIGAGVEIGANSVIGPGVAIGRRTRIGAGVLIQCALIGDDVHILAGAVIGEQGFGVAVEGGALADMPHLGRVIVQDRVTIGANCTIDRGVFGDTVLGEDAKLDNLCHIGHQAVIGRGVLIAAFGGVSGSTTVGDHAVLGGRVGIGDHRRIGARATLAAGAAVLQDVPEGETWGGYPARPLRRFLREVAWVSRKAGRRDGA